MDHWYESCTRIRTHDSAKLRVQLCGQNGGLLSMALADDPGDLCAEDNLH
jgi:hypothetical protein